MKKEYLQCIERLGDLQLFSVEKSRIREEITKVHKYLKGRSEDNGSQDFLSSAQ